MEVIKLFTDGGCRGNGKAENVGAIGVFLKFGEHEKEICTGYKNTTNNKMEMLSVIVGLEQLKVKDLPVKIYSDSAYVVNCMNQKWYKKWQVNGWKTSKREPVENQDLWEKMIELVESFTNIAFYKVKGHVNIDNESKVKEAHKNFKKNNGIDLSREELLEVLGGNNKADYLTNKGMDELEG